MTSVTNPRQSLSVTIATKSLLLKRSHGYIQTASRNGFVTARLQHRRLRSVSESEKMDASRNANKTCK